MEETSQNIPVPELGMAAAAFASLLVIASLESPSDELQRATEYFAVGIPIVVAGAFVVSLNGRTSRNRFRWTLRIIRLVCILFGDVGCGIGVYWVFRHVSGPSASLFLTVAIASWIAVGLLGLVVETYGQGQEGAGSQAASMDR